MAYANFLPNQPSGGSIYSSATMRNNFNALYQGCFSALKVEATDPPSLQVYVNPSNVENFYNQVWMKTDTPLSFSGGNSPSIVPPTSNNRIDLLTIDSNGNLEWTYGDESATPSAPDCPANKLPLAYIYSRVGMTEIVSYEDKTLYPSGGYIYKDVRPFLNQGGGVFKKEKDVVKQNSDTYDEDFVFGSPQLNDDGDTNHDARMFFDKSKGAFRAGKVINDRWDYTNRGYYSFACGYNTKANGDSSHAEGSGTFGSGDSSHAEGYNTTASGVASHAEGYHTTASSDYSHAEGWNTTASGIISHAEGHYSKAYLRSQHSHASYYFSTTGDAQYSRVEVMASTTDATQTTMYIANNSSYKLVLPASTTWGFRINLVARSDSGVSSYWEIKGVIKRDGANNTTLVGSITKTLIAQDSGASSWDVTAEADDTNEALAIKVTGASSTNIRWVATVELTEVGY